MTRVCFGFDDAVVCVESADPEVIDLVRRLFPVYEMHRESGPPPDFGIRRTSDGRFELTGEEMPDHLVSLPDALSALDYAIARRLLRERADVVQLHAAGAEVDGQALLIVGPSGAGKSNLALAMHRRDHRLLGDDLILIDTEGRAHAFARLVKVETERAEAFGFDPEGTLGRDEGNPEVWVDPRLGPGWSASPVPVGMLVFAHRRPGGGIQVEGCRESRALADLMSQVVGTGLQGALALDVLLAVTSRADRVRLVFDDAEEAAAQLEERLRGNGAAP